jgi:hypothetical protein
MRATRKERGDHSLALFVSSIIDIMAAARNAREIKRRDGQCCNNAEMKEWLIVVVSVDGNGCGHRCTGPCRDDDSQKSSSRQHSFDMAAKHCALALVLLVALQCTLAVAAVKKSVRFDFLANSSTFDSLIFHLESAAQRLQYLY